MTDETINIEIAKLLGFKVYNYPFISNQQKDELFCYTPNAIKMQKSGPESMYKRGPVVKDYCNDRSALLDAVIVLIKTPEHASKLKDVLQTVNALSSSKEIAKSLLNLNDTNHD